MLVTNARGDRIIYLSENEIAAWQLSPSLLASQEGDRWKMPLSVQAHHALMDGLHMARYYALIQEGFDQPDFLSG